MMNKSISRLLSLIASGLVAPALAGPTTAPTTAPSSMTATATPDMQAVQDFVKKVRPISMQLQAVEEDQAGWSDPAKRAALAPQAQAALKQLLPMIDDMVQRGKSREVELVGGDTLITVAAVFGDADQQQQVTQMASAADASGRWARAAQAASKYYLANDDEAGRGKALDALENLVSTDPLTKPLVARAEVQIYQSKPDKVIADRIDNYLTNTLKTRAISQVKSEMAAEAKRDALVDKPMVLAGPLKDGTSFSTADLKGKVILVDFWATWCGPCKAELPRVKKEYAGMHDKGLEVIGVSFDQNIDALNKFLAANPDMPWPQMFDPSHPFWHNELGKAYSIVSIPTMFLIDKNGICRSVKAREDFEKMIPQLLAEKAAT